MKCLVNLFVIFISCFISSCIDSTQRLILPFKIDIERDFNNMSVVNLSQLADTVIYISLESNDYFRVNANSKYDINDSLMLVYDLNYCDLYMKNGTYLNSIGSKGLGPGEYQFCVQACFSENNSVYMQSTLYDLSEYSLNGGFIKKYPGTFQIDHLETEFMYNWAIIFDTMFLGHVPNTTGKIRYKAVAVDKTGDLYFAWKNYDLFERKGYEFGFEKKAYFYYFNNSLHFKQYFNDTLFTLNGSNELIPKYCFNLGPLKMPSEIRERGFRATELWNYISVEDIFETKDFLFINCFFGNKFPARRITPAITPGGTSFYNTTYMLGVLNKRTGDLKFCKANDTDNPLFTTGINNDYDAGPNFFPQKMINDSVMLMTVETSELLLHIQSEDFKSNNPKFPDRKKMLEQFVSTLSEFDNPVLMIVTFKN